MIARNTMDAFYTVAANRGRRTLTIRVYHDGKLTSKYRTLPLSKEEFQYYSDFATQNDIRNFLRHEECEVIK